jgi:hypothetical protein
MKIDLTKPKDSNFEATGKDLKDIMFKLMTNEDLLKLLKYTTTDALTKPDLTPEEKQAIINDNIKVVPKLPVPDAVGSYIIIMFDTFTPNPNNTEFRDNVIIFDVICHADTWVMEDYMLRPYKIMHELDSMFNKSKLNGIGKVEFVAANSLVLTTELAGFTMMYKVINDI